MTIWQMKNMNKTMWSIDRNSSSFPYGMMVYLDVGQTTAGLQYFTDKIHLNRKHLHLHLRIVLNAFCARVSRIPSLK